MAITRSNILSFGINYLAISSHYIVIAAVFDMIIAGLGNNIGFILVFEFIIEIDGREMAV